MGITGDLRLRIDELVLHGFAPQDRNRIRDALELELGRLLRERGVPDRLTDGASRPSLDAGQITLAPGLGGPAIGERIALALYERLAAGDGAGRRVADASGVEPARARPRAGFEGAPG